MKTHGGFKSRLWHLSIAVVAAAALCVSILPAPDATAVSGGDWRAGRIIDDSVFLDANSMSVSQIQEFLNQKGGILREWRDNLVMPFPDKYDVNGNICYAHLPTNMTAAEIIQQAATSSHKRYVIWRRPDGTEIDGAAKANYTGTIQSCREQGFSSDSTVSSVSPKALLTMLQKEQALVTVTGSYSQDPNDYLRPSWPSNEYRLAWAMGYAVPDSGSRQHRYKGFYNQMTWAAYQLRRYMDYPQNYNFGVGNRNILYNPNTSCGSGTVNIETRATAALYNYTPYQPNQAALNNMYGTGDGCSAYGNRNFWRQYNDWFGSTIGDNYQWTIESFTYSGGDSLLAQGQTETLTLRARNTGRLPWYNHGSSPVRLGTWEPAGRVSPLASPGWVSNTRPANLTESTVQPNEVGTFTFPVTPNSQGTFAESLNLVAEGSQWMSWPGFRPTIVVTNGYQWQVDDVIYHDGSGVMDIGDTQLITVKARNTGNITWQKNSGAPVRLGTWPPQRGTAVAHGWLSPFRVADSNEMSVAPGQVAGYQFYVRMPAPGTYNEQLNLVAEGQSWFNDAGLTLNLRGKSFSWQPVWHAHSTGTANIPRNTDFSLTVKVRNTGETTWHKTGDYPVRLGTAGPFNRGSALYHSSWINDTRPAGLIENEVAPGAEGTFVFNARTPSTPGQRFERFSIVAEGLMWLNDPGFNIYVNVL